MHLSSANIALSAFLSFICKYFGFSESDSLTMVQITFISSKILDIYLNGGPEMFLSKVFIRSQYPSPTPPCPGQYVDICSSEWRHCILLPFGSLLNQL